MSAAIAVQQWPDQLEHVIARRCSLLKRVKVLAETDSTQDAARRLDVEVGDVITTWRQTAGRGRLGRAWADTGEEGVAVTFVVQRGEPGVLAIASAVGSAMAIERSLGRSVGIKWPNDIVLDGKKIAGVLIEQDDQRALIGIGVNVGQRVWPDELKHRAVSLAQLGTTIDRLDVLCAMLEMMEAALRMDADQLVLQFQHRDVLCGSWAGFRSGQTMVHGRIERIDPVRGLQVRTADGASVFLPAAITSVISSSIAPAVESA